MKSSDFKSMSLDALWELHERLIAELDRKMAAEKARLEERLRMLSALPMKGRDVRPRRPYRKVLPKFRNPSNPTETWAGRGKQPRWVQAELRSGKRLDDLRIKPS